jgi:hypothetical protein
MTAKTPQHKKMADAVNENKTFTTQEKKNTSRQKTCRVETIHSSAALEGPLQKREQTL